MGYKLNARIARIAARRARHPAKIAGLMPPPITGGCRARDRINSGNGDASDIASIVGSLRRA